MSGCCALNVANVEEGSVVVGVVLPQEARGEAALHGCAVGESAELRAAFGALKNEVAIAFGHFEAAFVVGACTLVGHKFAP